MRTTAGINMSSCGVKIIGTPVPRIQVAKEDDFEQWYQEILDKGDMVDQDPISKCLILKVCLPPP